MAINYTHCPALSVGKKWQNSQYGSVKSKTAQTHLGRFASDWRALDLGREADADELGQNATGNPALYDQETPRGKHPTTQNRHSDEINKTNNPSLYDQENSRGKHPVIQNRHRK